MPFTIHLDHTTCPFGLLTHPPRGGPSLLLRRPFRSRASPYSHVFILLVSLSLKFSTLIFNSKVFENHERSCIICNSLHINILMAQSKTYEVLKTSSVCSRQINIIMK